ncbi:single-stranded DNA-binding protein [Bradyrhizobium sp. CB82]|uniref:single-stranded DNA-binding protein n=1 Tax=Bradyrhizobium sp. CB82 TaxID=3039159 RepID=UPI0024B2386E|nr:single-stranded DNA-binding protein [Bradyrhizobium sp. CB82]WFU44199.1 single-stranded DNA-binding protein [Bradyrhizobium sp. CB82]
MTASVLIKGALFRSPESKISAGGKRYARATLKVKAAADDGVEWWSIMVFGDTAAEQLLDLRDGDHLAAQGQLRTELYQGKVRYTCFADQILPLRMKKKRKEKPEPSKPGPVSADADLNDAIPF